MSVNQDVGSGNEQPNFGFIFQDFWESIQFSMTFLKLQDGVMRILRTF
jgi:hypothetical protein